MRSLVLGIQLLKRNELIVNYFITLRVTPLLALLQRSAVYHAFISTPFHTSLIPIILSVIHLTPNLYKYKVIKMCVSFPVKYT